MRQLISEGRLEIAGGGWSMADEGASHYSAFVDNTAIGLNYMKDALGLQPFLNIPLRLITIFSLSPRFVRHTKSCLAN